jgi:hypothetical protein
MIVAGHRTRRLSVKQNQLLPVVVAGFQYPANANADHAIRASQPAVAAPIATK